MLPGVNAKKGLELANDRILIRIRPYANLPRLRILNQPSPSTPLNSRQLRIEDLLQFFKPTIRLIHRLFQGTARLTSTSTVLRRQVLPEERVVDVPAAVEIDGWLEGDLGGGIGGRIGGCGELFNCGVVVVYIGLVVLAVVELHYLTGDGRLEAAIIVCNIMSAVVR